MPGSRLRDASGRASRTPASEVGFCGVIDLKLLRDNPEAVRRSQAVRGENPALVDELLSADAARRAAIAAADNLRAEQKSVSKQVSAATPEDRPAVLARAKELSAAVKAAEADQTAAAAAVGRAHH